METDIEGLSWRDEFVTKVSVVKNDEKLPPTDPGQSIEINEKAARKGIHTLNPRRLSVPRWYREEITHG
jgi:hypothetical protein